MSLFNNIKIVATNQTSVSVDLAVTEDIEFPVGYDITATYEWRDNNNNIVSTDKDITYEFFGEDDIGLIITATYTDVDNNYEEVFADSITFDIYKKSVISFNFTTKFQANLYPRDQLNTDINRFMSYMPKWSSANKNFLSNYCKVNAPLADTISNMFFDMACISVSNISSEPFFEYPTELYASVHVDEPIYAEKDSIKYENAGYVNAASILNYPITRIVSEDRGFVSKISFVINANSNFQGTLLSKNSIVYVKPLVQVSELKFIEIFGLDENGNDIHESLSIVNSNIVASKFKYKYIRDIYADMDVKVSTYIDTSSEHVFRSGILPPKRIANQFGAFFDPIISVVDNTVEFSEELGLNKSTVRRFSVENQIDNLFVTNLLDIIYLSEGDLYACKPRLRVEAKVNINSSYNNNDIVYVDNASPKIGESIYFTVDTDKALAAFDSTQIQVCVIHGEDQFFITQSVGQSLSKDTWIELANRKSNITFGLPVIDDKDIVVKVYGYGFMSYFCAGGHVDQIDSYKIAEDVDDFFIYNNSLYIERNDLFYKPKLSRLCFTFDNSFIYTDTDLEGGQIHYE